MTEYHKYIPIATLFQKFVGLPTVLAALLTVTACSSTPVPKTEGERLLQLGNQAVDRAEDAVDDAEDQIADGKKKIRKGEKLIDEGEEEVNEGKQKLTVAREQLFLARRQQQAGEKLVKSEFHLLQGRRAYDESRRLQEGGLID